MGVTVCFEGFEVAEGDVARLLAEEKLNFFMLEGFEEGEGVGPG